MVCHLGYTIFCVLFLGCFGFVLSLMLLAPIYFSSSWSEKYAIEKAIMIGFPCLGAVSGFIIGPRNVDQGSSRRSASAQRSKEQQVRNRPTRTAVTQPSLTLPHTHAGIQDLEAQVVAKSQRASDISNSNTPHPAPPAPTAQNSSSWITKSFSNSESSTLLPPYIAQDPENPTVPTPSYSRYDRPSRPTQETDRICRICQTRHSKATYVNHSD